MKAVISKKMEVR